MQSQLLLRKYQQQIVKVVKILKKINPERIILFGSMLKGKITEKSDIDLCIIKKTKNRLELKKKISDLMWKYKVGFEPETQFHIYSPSIYSDWLSRGDPFIEEIEKGKVIYESQ